MPVLPIRLFPDPVLRKSASLVTQFDQNLMRLVQNMEVTMRAQRSGIGIAAPQVGSPVQVAVVDVSERLPGAQKMVLVNPQILESHTERLSREGCMSLPEYTGNLVRYDWIRLRWQDVKGRVQESAFSGLEAVCIQHEVDHLAGRLFLDRISFLNRDLIPRHFPSKSNKRSS